MTPEQAIATKQRFLNYQAKGVAKVFAALCTPIIYLIWMRDTKV
jgi:hypothetical protein